MPRESKYTINRRNTEKWKDDTLKSVSLYNEWFLNFAPATYARERKRAMERVGSASILPTISISRQRNLRDIRKS